jgi:caspase domain-containing protein
MLVLLYGFERSDIVTLTDQTATRAAILQTIDKHLVQPAAPGDVLFFYYAGHGSQVRNSLSKEPDALDESLVPADSRTGARDIRDKELRVLFNQILDRGARLTILLDNCHSGSGARGLATGEHPRGVSPDLRDVADGADHGPRPEERGALVLSASQDFDLAWETHDELGVFHGAFSWAWIRALRDSSAGEPAFETFLRAAARLRAETPFQEPVLAGNAEARLNPFLGVRVDRRADRTVVAVEKLRGDGSVALQGGWANGLSIGSELQIMSEGRTTARLTITALRGLGQSDARMQTTSRVLPQSLKPGALLEVVGWAAPPARPLRVWMPRARGNVDRLTTVARMLAAEAARRRVRWISDPIDSTPVHVLRQTNADWELLGPSGCTVHLATDAAAIAAISRIPAGSSLFVQFAAPAALVDDISIGPGTDREDIEPANRPQDADYILVGRYHARRMAYAWLRPSVQSSDRRKTGLPLRSRWIEEEDDRALSMRDALLRLRRIQAWHFLDSPPDARAAYRLGIRRSRDGELVKDPVVIGDERYELVLRAAATPLARTPQRYMYVFTIDSYGKSVLLFPGSGSVENRFPVTMPPPPEIRLGATGSFEIAPPFGVDTYFLLTTDEPLPNPWILEWDGVRTRSTTPLTSLEQLLSLTGSSTRSGPMFTPSNWSLEKLVFESVPARARR